MSSTVVLVECIAHWIKFIPPRNEIYGVLSKAKIGFTHFREVIFSILPVGQISPARYFNPGFIKVFCRGLQKSDQNSMAYNQSYRQWRGL
jgi:hypothetical protein